MLALPMTAFAQGRSAVAPVDICVFEGAGVDHPRFVAPPAGVSSTVGKAAGSPSAATFNVNYVNESQSDPWPAEARDAFDYATAVWASLVSSPVAINVEATWADLGACSGNSFTLGAAGPQLIWADFVGAPNSSTWYPDALADALRGFDLGNGDTDILAEFNSQCGPGQGNRWYFGTDGNTPAGRIDFASVVIHELAHGLGFFGSAIVDDGSPANGQECNGTGGVGCLGLGDTADPVVYDRFAEDAAGTALLTYVNPSVQLASVLRGVQGGGVFFDGFGARQANGGLPAQLYTDDPFESAVSFSHLDESTFNDTPHALMTPFLSQAEAIHSPGAVVCGMMADIGWSVTGQCENGGGAVEVEDFELSSAYPNPTAGSAAIELAVEIEQDVDIGLFDVVGRRLATIYSGDLAANTRFTFTIPAESQGVRGAGVYFVHVVAQTFRATRAVVVVR